MGTATVDLIEQTRDKANVLRSNFATNSQIVTYLNEARKQFRELLISADDSYYRASLDFSVGADPDNLQALPADFWKLRGLDAWAGTARQAEIYAREFRNRHRGDRPGYYFDGGYIVIVPSFRAATGNPYRIFYTPIVVPLAETTDAPSRTVAHALGDNAATSGTCAIALGRFNKSDEGAAMTVAGDTGGNAGAYEIVEVLDASTVVTSPPPPVSAPLSAGTVVTVAPISTGTRTFAATLADTISTGVANLTNAVFNPSDVGAILTASLDGAAAGADGDYTITAVISATAARVVPVPLSVSGFTGAFSISRQPIGTVGELDEHEESFSEYFPVRAAQAIARKKRQDSLVAQLGVERTQIEARISQMGKNRQSEPQQAPVLWRPGVRRHGYCDTDWDI